MLSSDDVGLQRGLLDYDEYFAWRLWWCPEGAGWRFRPDSTEEQLWGFLPPGRGAAEKMSVELGRREGDGEYRFSIVGRDHDLSEPLTETTDVQTAHEPRHPAELFTADQAAPELKHSVEHQTAPDGYTLRLIADV